MQKMNNKGFGAVGILLVLVTLMIVGGAGWYVFNKSKDAPETSQSTVSDGDQDTEQTERDKYLEVAEFGIKIKLTDGVEDMTYAVKTDSFGSKYAVLSTESLSELEPECSADFTTDSVEGVGLIVSSSSLDAEGPVMGYTWGESYPDNVKVGDVYYTIMPNVQSPCYDPNEYDYDTSEVARKNKAAVFFLRDEAVLEKL